MDVMIDDNNNSPEKCYSLRPRAAPKRDEDDSDHEDQARPSARKKKKSKQKPNRLSKYRRKTANARERSRMREINEAFEALRRAIPHLSPCTESSAEKLTKISTLRLAMKYITALSHALSEPGESDAESFLSDYSLTPSDPREHSMTPSSVSDHSDFYDQFFHKSVSASGSISPCEQSGPTPAAPELSFALSDCAHPLGVLETTESLPPPSALDPLPPFYHVSPSVCERPHPPFPLPNATSVPDPIFRGSNPRATDLQEPMPSSELESLLYPSLNFDELFIT